MNPQESLLCKGSSCCLLIGLFDSHWPQIRFLDIGFSCKFTIVLLIHFESIERRKQLFTEIKDLIGSSLINLSILSVNRGHATLEKSHHD